MLEKHINELLSGEMSSFGDCQRLLSINNITKSQHANEKISALVIFGSDFVSPMVGLTLCRSHLSSTIT